MAREEAEWEATLQLRRKQAIGALALNLLEESLKQRLCLAKGYFDATHPRRGRYSGDGWPNRFKAEYEHRFRIDFNNSPVPFSRIEELVLARNAGIHRGIDDYLKKIKNPRFVNDDGKFSVDVTNYRSAVKDVKDFTKWVISELKKFRA